MSQRPAAIGMFVCEQVIIEESTKNVTPVNCFTRRRVRQFPSDPFEFVVFAMLNDGSGEIRLKVAIQRLDTLDEIYERTVSARFVDPLKENRCIFRIRDCSFPVSGAYQALLYADKEMLAQKGFRVTLKETP